MEVEEKHWVEDLFTPHFSTDDFFHQTFEPDQLISEKLAKERAKRVEKIYHAALGKAQESQKLKRKEFLSKLIVRDYKSEQTAEQKRCITDQHGTCASCMRVNVVLPGTADRGEHCIWTGDELSALRHEMTKKQSEGARLKLQLNVGKIEISELKAAHKTTEKELEAVKEALTISRRESDCKSVLLKQMEKDRSKQDAELQALKKDLHGKCVMLCSLNKEVMKARQQIQELELNNRDLEQELKTLKQQQELKSAASIEKAKLKYRLEINKLLREMKTIKEEMNNGKIQHGRDLVALELLRKHFSSISTTTSNFVQLNILPH
ncbi:hypothetical protein FKM82_002449 [Ascaphus truei]